MHKEIKAKRITVKGKDGEVLFDFKVGKGSKQIKELLYFERTDPVNFGNIRSIHFTKEEGDNPLWMVYVLGDTDTVDIVEA